jgi:hypothetical protein
MTNRENAGALGVMDTWPRSWARGAWLPSRRSRRQVLEGWEMQAVDYASRHEQGKGAGPRRGSGRHRVGGVGPWLPAGSFRDAEHRRHRGNRQVDFLIRALAAALLALSPGAWAARRRDDTSSQRGVLVGLAVYLFASSLVDLHAFVNDVVGVAALPAWPFGRSLARWSCGSSRQETTRKPEQAARVVSPPSWPSRWHGRMWHASSQGRAGVPRRVPSRSG